MDGNVRRRKQHVKVIMVLKKFTTEHWEDFSDDMVKRLETFIFELLDDGHTAMVRQLRSVVNKKRAQQLQEGGEKARNVMSSGEAPQPLLPANICSEELAVADVAPLELARQITLVDSEIFRKVRYRARMLLLSLPLFASSLSFGSHARTPSRCHAGSCRFGRPNC